VPPRPDENKATTATAEPVRPAAPPVAKQAPTPKTVPAQPPPAPAAGFSVDWLLRQPRSGYTLQLAGLRDRAAGQRFIQRHGLTGKAALLTSRRDGQAWYVLVHGYYPNRQAALTAANRLPPAVRKEVKPWARSVGEIAALPR
jgi:septal ring-binding cell division protein DamX